MPPFDFAAELAREADRLFHAGEIEAAAGRVARLACLHPDNPALLDQLALALDRLGGRGAEVEAVLCRAVALGPKDADRRRRWGDALLEAGRPAEAIDAFESSLNLAPDHPDALLGLGLARLRAGAAAAAEAALRRALAQRPGHMQTLNNLGNALRAQGAVDAAIEQYRAAVAADPAHPVPGYNLALSLLLVGAFPEGWARFERRGAALGEAPSPLDPRLRWGGEALAGRTVLLTPEQALGDQIQFIRFAEAAAARGVRVLLGAQAPMVRLLASAPGVDRVLTDGPMPMVDRHLPILSLPGVLGIRFADLPGRVPYLFADRDQIAAWRRRLAGLPGPRVGIAWSGRAIPDPRRSIPFEALAPLFALPGVSWVSLQMGPPADRLAELPAAHRPFDPRADIADVADTAALIGALDLVISIDTMVAHLAGALGAPVWVLLRDDACWRWHRDRDDSPWYPTARLFRQTGFDDWPGVVERVGRALAGGEHGEGIGNGG